MQTTLVSSALTAVCTVCPSDSFLPWLAMLVRILQSNRTYKINLPEYMGRVFIIIYYRLKSNQPNNG